MEFEKQKKPSQPARPGASRVAATRWTYSVHFRKLGVLLLGTRSKAERLNRLSGFPTVRSEAALVPRFHSRAGFVRRP